MAEAGSPQDQWEEGFEDEFGEIIKSRSGRRKRDLAFRLEFSCITNKLVLYEPQLVVVLAFFVVFCYAGIIYSCCLHVGCFCIMYVNVKILD